jgi:hypothetical protein
VQRYLDAQRQAPVPPDLPLAERARQLRELLRMLRARAGQAEPLACEALPDAELLQYLRLHWLPHLPQGARP